VPFATIDGIATRYQVEGSGPPLLMYSPGGFDSRLENWRTLGVYRSTGLMAALTRRYTCISFDRRESGRSGGRVQRLGWDAYVRQGKGLLDHLGIARAHLMGGCVGCSSVAALAIAYPDVALSMVLYSPAGGPRYRMAQHARFWTHASFVREHGTAGVVRLAGTHALSFTRDPRVGPWCSVIRTNPDFAEAYGRLDRERYLSMVGATARVMYDRDTVPGAEPEDLMALEVPTLIVPGDDPSHATSAARYLQECLPLAEYWDAPIDAQTPETAPQRVIAFLDAH
jgi:pimeloyl-ACP methyl ester carboxylesterase